MAAEAARDEAAPAPRQALTFLDLPPETQQEIVSHCSQSDLICVALVSKHFHELAASQLYRNFNILFPDDDDVRFDSPIDGLAGGLDTFATSEYNYAKHLKELSMDTVSTGIKAEHAYKPYLYSSSCGKFLNTLLSLTLKKAKALETFRWNIRVELSRPVYRELHKIRTLTTLHIRMQAGESYYTTPPPLPLLLDDAPPPNHWPDSPPSSTPPFPIPVANGSSSNLSAPKFKRLPRKRSILVEPPTISGFSKLKNLSILDIDNLDVVPELKACVRNSSSTLKELQLSFSDSLASQARSLLLGDSDPDDSDVDDEFHVPPASPPGSNYGDNGPGKSLLSSEERKLQEAVLGKIFDVESFVIKKFPSQHDANDLKEEQSEDPEEDDAMDAKQEFVSAIKGVSTKLMTLNNGSRHFSVTQQEILDVIERAARKYVDSVDIPVKSQEAESSESADQEEKKSVREVGETEAGPSEPKQISDSSTHYLFKGRGIERDLTPDDIDIAHPDVVDDVDDDLDDQSGKLADESPLDDVKDAGESFPPEEASTTGLLSDNQATATRSNSETFTSKLGRSQEQRDLKNIPSGKQEEQCPGSHRRSMDDYIRDTRGFSLETLSIHLIPVKASVLSRAMDLSCIKNLTLLNVGNQAPIWTMLSKENKLRPLALRSVFTDNVSTAFLNCMSQLDELHELFMLERSSKHRPEPFAPKTTVTIDQIRRLVLKKHMPTLKRLMIKDESIGSKWDANQKTMILICNAGIQLEELAVSMNILAVHAFMQYFAGLVNLKAINILHFRNNDTCIWVMRETLNFIVDNLSHHPELQLEWIAMENDRLDRVIRPSQTTKTSEEPKRRDKGKGKATTNTDLNHNDSLPLLPMSEWGSDSESDEDEEDAFNCGKRLRLKTVGVLQFYEVWGIKIFEKELRTGRL